MVSISRSDVSKLQRAKVVDASGSSVGNVSEVYLDADTNEPEWALIGGNGTSANFVPLAEATLRGKDLHVPYERDTIQGSPAARPDQELSQEEEARLYAYYGLPYSEAQSDSGLPQGGAPMTGQAPVGRDISGPETDSAMTRSEERLHIGTQRVETGRARLRKYIVTDTVTQTVPVTREEVRIEREPITEANRGKAMDGPALSEEEHEITLTEERPVVSKTAVPVERVRLDTETVTEQVRVDEQLRKEEIEIDESGLSGRNR